MNALSRRQFLVSTAAATFALGAGLAAAADAGQLKPELKAFGLKRRMKAPESLAKLRELSEFMTDQIGKKVIPGAALMVTVNGDPFWQASWGNYCNGTTKDAPVNQQLRHSFFSFSKLVSSTVILRLVQEKQLSLSDPVAKLLPAFGANGKGKITLRHLLTHSAGIPNVTIESVETEAKWQKAFDAICAAKPEWEPGSKCIYHGLTGQFIAACMARKALANQTWEAIAQEKLFKPLEAPSLTYLAKPDPAQPLALTPQPDTLPAQAGKSAFLVDGHPAGGCLGTAQDAIKVVEMHNNRGRCHGKEILNVETWMEMHRVQYADQIAAAAKDNKPSPYQSWGLGPLLRGSGPADGGHSWFGFHDLKNPNIFGHAGIDTVIGVGDPDRKIALFLACTNSPSPSQKANEIRNGVTNRVWASVPA